MQKKVTLNHFAKSFGIKKNKFSKNFLNIYKKCNFKYIELNNHEEQKLIKFIINKITMTKEKQVQKQEKLFGKMDGMKIINYF